jgi:hypothetical protein
VTALPFNLQIMNRVLAKVESMNLYRIATPRAVRNAGLGMLVLAAMPFSYAWAEAPAAAPAKTEAPAAAPAKTEAPATTAPAKTESAPAPAKLAAKAAAPAKPSVPAAPAECVRTGQRVIAALARDDTNAAMQFFTFYNAFKCSPTHLSQAFACLVKLQTANPGLANPAQEQVNQCWNDPAIVPKVAPAPAAQPTEQK